MHIPVRPVLFLKENRRERSRGRGKVGEGSKKSEGRGNCSWDETYEIK